MRILRRIGAVFGMDSQLRIGLGARLGCEQIVGFGRHLPWGLCKVTMELRGELRFGMDTPLPTY
jgi:hypothetical protein